MQAPNGLLAAKGAQELGTVMQDIERITPLYTKLADADFDEGSKVANFKVLIPTQVYNFKAVQAKPCGTYGSPVQMA